jgi:PAS domain S-box-containing protein
MTFDCTSNDTKTSSPFEILFQNASIGIVVIDPKGFIQCINPFALKMFGYDKQELIFQPLDQIIPDKYYLKHGKHKKIYSCNPINRTMGAKLEMFALKKNGEEIPIEISLSSFNSNNEKYTVAFINDISERKKNDLLREKEEKYRNIIFNINIGLLEVDTSGLITFANQKFAQMSGYSLNEIIGKKADEIFISGDQNYLMKSKSDLRIEGISDVSRIQAKNKNGELRWWLISGAPNYDDNGNIIGSVGIHLDITDQKQKEDQLQENLKKEKEVNGLKSRFVSMASHEFRTPLSTVLSSSYLIEKYTTTEDQIKRQLHLKHIVSSVNILTGILNDLLSVGKIEEGKIQLRNTEFDIEEMIILLINQMSNGLKKRQKIFYNHVGPSKIILDENLLKHILMNLISNASKFSNEGSFIEINTITKSNKITVSVKDYGIGISKSDQKHLTETFFRGGNVDHIQGTGLGLHIVTEYTHLMEGKITWKSTINKGTEFILTFTNKNNIHEKNLTN